MCTDKVRRAPPANVERPARVNISTTVFHLNPLGVFRPNGKILAIGMRTHRKILASNRGMHLAEALSREPTVKSRENP